MDKYDKMEFKTLYNLETHTKLTICEHNFYIQRKNCLSYKQILDEALTQVFPSSDTYKALSALSEQELVEQLKPQLEKRKIVFPTK
jgi:hypothetical protein